MAQGHASEKTLQDIEALLTTQAGYLDGVETLLTTINTSIQDIGGMTARTYAAPQSFSYSNAVTHPIVAANANRKLLVIELVIATNVAYLGIGNDAEDAKGIKLQVSAVPYHITFGSVPRIHNAGSNLIEISLPLTTQAINMISGSNQSGTYQEAT